MKTRKRIRIDKLEGLVDRYEGELRDAGLGPLTIGTYTDQSRRFVKWLAGEYSPRGPNRDW